MVNLLTTNLTSFFREDITQILAEFRQAAPAAPRPSGARPRPPAKKRIHRHDCPRSVRHANSAG